MEHLSKAKLKFFTSLQLKKFRDEHQLYLVEGWKLVEEAILSGQKIESLVIRSNEMDKFEGLGVSTTHLHIFEVDDHQFNRVSSHQNPEGILAIVNKNLSPSTPRTGFILDNIRDPGNLGTIMRTADWFGMDGIILSSGCADPYNPKVVRSSMGAIFRLKIHQLDDLNTFAASLQEKIVVADLKGAALQQTDLSTFDFILLGNESAGISSQIQRLPGVHSVSIPGLGKMESLNVGVSGAIIAWEWAKSRSYFDKYHQKSNPKP